MASIIKRRRPPGQTRTNRKRKQKEGGDGTASPRHKSRRSKGEFELCFGGNLNEAGENGETVAVDPAACPTTPTPNAAAAPVRIFQLEIFVSSL